MINAAVNDNIPAVSRSRGAYSQENGISNPEDFMSNILKAAEEIGLNEENIPTGSDEPFAEKNKDNTENPDVLAMCMQMNSLNVPDMQIPENNSTDVDMLSVDDGGLSAENMTVFSMQNDGLLYKNTNLSDFAVEKFNSQPIIQIYDSFSDTQENEEIVQNSDINGIEQDIPTVDADMQIDIPAENNIPTADTTDMQIDNVPAENDIPTTDTTDVHIDNVSAENNIPKADTTDVQIDVSAENDIPTADTTDMQIDNVSAENDIPTADTADVQIDNVSAENDIPTTDTTDVQIDNVPAENDIPTADTTDMQIDVSAENDIPTADTTDIKIDNVSADNDIPIVNADTIPQDNILSYVHEDIASTENVSENKSEKTIGTNPQNTAESEISPKVTAQPKSENNRNNFGNSASSQENGSSFSNEKQDNPLIREHRIQFDFHKNIEAVKNIIRSVSENANEEKSDISSIELSAEKLNIADLQTMFIPQNNLQEIADISQNETVYDAQEIIKQTTDGIASGLKSADGKFTVKLNPEGLGEITVTILKHDNSSILTLSATDSRTAEILNSNIKSLQENLRYLNIEIADVQVDASENTENYQSYSEQFEQNSSRYKRSNDEKQHHGSDDDDDDMMETDYSVEDILSLD